MQVGRDLKAQHVAPALQSRLVRGVRQQRMTFANSSDDDAASAIKTFLQKRAEANLFGFRVVEVDDVVTWFEERGAKRWQPGS